MIQRFYPLAPATIVWLSLFSAAEARCPALGGNIQNGDDQFFTSNLSGRLAYLRGGPDSKTYDVLDDCNEIRVNGPTRLNFIINNVFVPKGADGKASFAAVQVAKLQIIKQSDLNVTLERTDGWIRDGVEQLGFGPISIKNMNARRFFDTHLADKFDDGLLKYKNWWWHAAPLGGTSSSSDAPDKWNWNAAFFADQSDRIVLSNRLYSFSFNDTRNTGIPFYVKVDRTDLVYIRYFAPVWAEEPQLYVIEIR